MSEPSTDEPDCVKAIQEPEPLTRRKLIHLICWEYQLPHKYVVAFTPGTNSLDIDVEIETTDTSVKHCAKLLIDCDVTGLFKNTEWACTNNVTMCALTQLIPVYNVDRTPNEDSAIRQSARLQILSSSTTDMQSILNS